MPAPLRRAMKGRLPGNSATEVTGIVKQARCVTMPPPSDDARRAAAHVFAFAYR